MKVRNSFRPVFLLTPIVYLAMAAASGVAQTGSPPISNSLPEVRIIAPTNGAVFGAPANVNIDAYAYDGTNSVAQVQFFDNGGLIGSITNPVVPPGALPPIRLSYSLVWSNVQTGDYALTVTALFRDGLSATSAPVDISVVTKPPPTNPPSVVIITPTNHEFFAAPANISIVANASDPDGFLDIATVEFFAGTNRIGITTNNPVLASPLPPFHIYWTNVPVGVYVLTAVATDKEGLTGTSAPVNISVVQLVPPPTNIPPTAVITGPTNGSAFAAPANVLISANVSDPDDFVHIVAFYAGSNRLAMFILDPPPGETNTTSLPISFLWQNVFGGSYDLTVVATDTRGASGTSAPVNITVTGPTNPIPLVTIVATDPTAVEGTNFCFPFIRPATIFTNFCTGTNTATFLVRRIGDTNGALTVFYSIGGTASNGVDYITLPGQVTIPDGQRYALITIDPLEDIDASARRYETVVLALTEPPTASGTPPPYLIGWPGKAAAIILEECNFPVPVACPLPGDCFHVAWPGINGQNYCLQFSANLVDWTPVCTNTVVKGTIDFVDPEASGSPSRYYRAVPVAGPPVY